MVATKGTLTLLPPPMSSSGLGDCENSDVEASSEANMPESSR